MMNRTVARVFDILQMIADSAAPLTMAAIRRELDLPKSSASDLINSLVELEVLEFNQEEANSLDPGIRFFELSSKFVNRNRLLAVARKNMVALVRDTGDSAFLMQFDGSTVSYLEKVDAPGRLQSHYSPGEEVPLHASASGKAVLAALPEDWLEKLLGPEPFRRFSGNTLTTYAALRRDIELSRRRKYSIENRERDDYLVSVAAPIRQSDGTVIAAVSLANIASHMPEEKVRRGGAMAAATAKRISRFLGYTGLDLYDV